MKVAASRVYSLALSAGPRASRKRADGESRAPDPDVDLDRGPTLVTGRRERYEDAE